MKAVVTVVPFNNTSTQLELYARALALATREAALVADVDLLYLDNGEPSGLSAQVPGGRALTPRGNIGYGPALNLLLQHAFNELHADVVVTSNPDGAFHHDCLRMLLSPLQTAPLQLLEARQFPAEHPKEYDPETGDTPWASGCCVAISRAVYDLVGNVDPAFWLYLEDVDFAWRARAKGVPVRLVHEALYAHDVTDGRDSEFVQRQMLLSGRTLAHKWRNPKFERLCERQLHMRLGVDPARLAPLDTVTPVPQDWIHVADFSRSFSFARTRW